MHGKITQCKLHAGMRPYVRNKYLNWLALDMIQRLNTRAGVLKRTRRNSFEQYHFQLLARAPSLRSLNIARLPSVLDPIVMNAVNSVHSFGLFPRPPRFLPQRIAGSGYEIEFDLFYRHHIVCYYISDLIVNTCFKVNIINIY